MGLLPRRRRRLPAEIQAALAMGRGERIIAWGSDPRPDGTVEYLVATDRALYLQGRGERIAWDSITKATWAEPVLELVIADAPSRLLRVTAGDSGDLPAAVHDRVTSSVLVSERLDLGEGRGAKAVARRNSDDGPVRWSVVFDAGLDPSDPALREAADRALADLRGSLGI
jgi:hypothetical protein